MNISIIIIMKNILKEENNSAESHHVTQSSIIHKHSVYTILSENRLKFNNERLVWAHQRQTIFENNIFIIYLQGNKFVLFSKWKLALLHAY